MPPNYPELFRRAGDLVDKILRGTKPGFESVGEPLGMDLRPINALDATEIERGIAAFALRNERLIRAFDFGRK